MIDFFSTLFTPGTAGFVLLWILVAVIAAVLIMVVVFLIRSGRWTPYNFLDGSGFCYDKDQDIFFSALNPWQRKYGYCELYDETAPMLSMIIDCEPIRFEYEGKRWLIELWKGQYGMTTGCEVGVYTTKGPDLNIPKVFDGTFYGDTEDQLQIAICLLKNGKPLFVRNCRHWWLTGFLLGEFSQPEELQLQAKITLKTEEMCEVFVEAIKKVGYKEDEFAVEGKTVYILFDKPYSPQAITRIPAMDEITQEKNKLLCDLFQKAVPDEKNALEKVVYLKKNDPRLYRKLSKMTGNKKRYAGFKKIRRHL